MSVLNRLLSYTGTVNDETADTLSTGGDMYTVEIHPPRRDDVPATLTRFIREIMELQSRWKLWNVSPVTVFEIRRNRSGHLQLQFAAPTKRLERKIRNHLTEQVPGIKFDTGISGIPVARGDTVGGGVLTTGRSDAFPLRTEFDRPPTNNIVASLHRHSMDNLSIIVQILFQPLAGRPVRNRWWRRRAYKRVAYLRKEKHGVDPRLDREATPQERQQADKVEAKARNPLFRVGIRFLLIGVDEDFVRSRVKELAGSFNVFESPVTNQYLDTHTVKTVQTDRLIRFAESVAYRRLDGWVIPFRAGIPELAGLIAVPSIEQANIEYAAGGR